MERRWFLSIVGAAVLILATAACDTYSVSAHEAEIDAPRVAITVDPSTSSNRFELALPSAAEIRQIADELTFSGGEIQLFFVRESGRTVGERLALPSPKPRPAPPQVSANLLSPHDAALREEFAKRMKYYETQEALRVTECRRRVDNFVALVEKQFAIGRTVQRSAVKEALYFAARFLNAPPLAAHRPGKHILLTFSDCQEFSPESPAFELPDGRNLMILWVTPDPRSRFPLPGAEPALFASRAQAVDFAIAQLQAGRGEPNHGEEGHQ
jgi:hypothetical protein